MPKAPRWLSVPAALLLLAACAGESLVPEPLPPDVISPEADLGAPGMIPVECETLLQQSQNWGYRPGESWRPASDAQAVEVAKFFGAFFLVPENAARYYQAWISSPLPESEAEAKKQIDLLARAQSCDPSLALSFLEGVIGHRWSSKLSRKEAAEGLLLFILNQQTRMAPLISRAVMIHMAEKAKQKGILSGPAAPVRQIRTRLDRERAKIIAGLGTDPSALLQVQALRKEFALSEKAREELSRYLPLP